MLSRLARAVGEFGKRMEALEVHGATAAAQHFWLRSFCDVYLVGGVSVRPSVHPSVLVGCLCSAPGVVSTSPSLSCISLMLSPLDGVRLSVPLIADFYLPSAASVCPSYPTCPISLTVPSSPSHSLLTFFYC